MVLCVLADFVAMETQRVLVKLSMDCCRPNLMDLKRAKKNLKLLALACYLANP
jgi:hypothetical protein